MTDETKSTSPPPATRTGAPAEVVVAGRPLTDAATEAAAKAAKDAEDRKAKLDAEASKKITAHQEKVAGEIDEDHPAAQAAADAASSEAAQTQRKAALLKDAIGAKLGIPDAPGVEAEAQRLAQGEHASKSEWDRNHYGAFNKEVLEERNAVVAGKEGDTTKPSAADSAGLRIPAPGPTPGSARRVG